MHFFRYLFRHQHKAGPKPGEKKTSVAHFPLWRAYGLVRASAAPHALRPVSNANRRETTLARRSSKKHPPLVSGAAHRRTGEWAEEFREDGQHTAGCPPSAPVEKSSEQ